MWCLPMCGCQGVLSISSTFLSSLPFLLANIVYTFFKYFFLACSISLNSKWMKLGSRKEILMCQMKNHFFIISNQLWFSVWPSLLLSCGMDLIYWRERKDPSQKKVKLLELKSWNLYYILQTSMHLMLSTNMEQSMAWKGLILYGLSK